MRVTMRRLEELLSRELIGGRDDAELAELAELLDTYRRQPVTGWEPCELDGQPAHRRALDCGHVEIVLGPAPRGGVIRAVDGTAIEIPPSAVCLTCARVRADG